MLESVNNSYLGRGLSLSRAIPLGPIKKQPIRYWVCGSPRIVGSSATQPRRPSPWVENSVMCAHICTKSVKRSKQVGLGSGPEMEKTQAV